MVAHQVGHALLPLVHCWSTADAGQVLRLQPIPRGHRIRLLTGAVKFIYVRARLHIRDASSTSTEDANVYEPCTVTVSKDRRVNVYPHRVFLTKFDDDLRRTRIHQVPLPSPSKTSDASSTSLKRTCTTTDEDQLYHYFFYHRGTTTSLDELEPSRLHALKV